MPICNMTFERIQDMSRSYSERSVSWPKKITGGVVIAFGGLNSLCAC